jgi:molybdenum cofactor synthesis domain-containing protein
MSHELGAPVEIIAVGRELLRGQIVDASSAWLAARLPALGGRVTRIAVVDDDPPAIAREIRHARANGAALVVTTGGLGPTAEDRTLVGVAAGLGRGLREHPVALASIARRYAALGAQGAVADATLTAERRKMAVLPEGADFIENTCGIAPGVLAGTPAFAVLSLPDAPPELRLLVDAVADRIALRLGTPVSHAERELASDCGDESRLTTLVERVMATHPGVHVKSLPASLGRDANLRVRLTASGGTALEAEERVTAAATTLTSLLRTLKE